MATRVVITAAGVVSPIGTGLERFSEALRGGVSGGGPITLFDSSGFPTQIACEVDGFDPQAPFATLMERVPALHTAVMPRQDRKTAFGLAAALGCVEQSGIAPEALTGEPCALHVGTGLSSVTVEQLEADMMPFLDERGRYDQAAFGEHALWRPSPSPWRHITSEANRLIVAALGIEGPTTSNFSACAASLQAVGRAYRDIQAGRVRRALAGGMDSMAHPFGMISFIRLGALSTANDDPKRASRPFDKERDGFVLGEGGAMVMLESLEAARERGATILAEVLGYGTSIDAYMVTAPHPEGHGARLAIQRAVRDAGVALGEVDYVNAHGTATPLNDSTESRAIGSVWREAGLEAPPVSSTKSMTGHLIAAAGVLEAVACVAALRGGFLPPSINITEQDPECDVPVVNASAGVDADVRIAMTNSFGFGGQNGVMLFKRWEG